MAAVSGTRLVQGARELEIAPLGDSPSIHDALRRADLNLYAAKQSGRDRAQDPDGSVQQR